MKRGRRQKECVEDIGTPATETSDLSHFPDIAECDFIGLLRRSRNGVYDLDSCKERNHGITDWERRAGGHVARPSKQAHGPAPLMISSRRPRTPISTRSVSQVDGVKTSRFSGNNGRYDTKSSALTRARVGLSYIEDAIDQGLTDKEVNLVFDEVKKLGQRAGWIRNDYNARLTSKDRCKRTISPEDCVCYTCRDSHEVLQWTALGLRLMTFMEVWADLRPAQRAT